MDTLFHYTEEWVEAVKQREERRKAEEKKRREEWNKWKEEEFQKERAQWRRLHDEHHQGVEGRWMLRVYAAAKAQAEAALMRGRKPARQ